jgi:membrane-associated PAP2 superfamily phosphatase
MPPLTRVPQPLTPLQRDLGVAALAAMLLLAWDLAGLDRAIVRQFGDLHGFAWRDAWLTSTLMHQGGRVLAWGVFAFLLLDLTRPIIRGPQRTERARALAATLACLVAVPGVKRLSSTSCPWDLDEFGGVAHYVSHWRFGVSDGGAGHCFPSGHAVAAFAFLSVYFLLRPSRPSLARAWLTGVLVTGLVFGAAQMLRGAHYPSHTLWSAWLCWITCLLVAHWPQRRLAPSGDTPQRPHCPQPPRGA